MLTVVIPWCNRSALGEALRRNAPLLGEFETIVVNVGGSAGEISRHIDESGRDRIRTIHVRRDQFNKSLALNLGIALASTERCLILDCDIHLSDYDFVEAFRNLDDNAFVTLKRVTANKDRLESPPSFLSSVHNIVEFRFADGRKEQVETSGFRKDDASRTGPGILLARRSWLTSIAGYNSSLEGWGWEDIDVILRLQLAGFERRHMGTGRHLDDHAAASSLSTARQQSEMRNRSIAYGNYAAGNFMGTLEQDVAACSWRAAD